MFPGFNWHTAVIALTLAASAAGVLYRIRYEHLPRCPKCSTGRLVRGSDRPGENGWHPTRECSSSTCDYTEVGQLQPHSPRTRRVLNRYTVTKTS